MLSTLALSDSVSASAALVDVLGTAKEKMDTSDFSQTSSITHKMSMMMNFLFEKSNGRRKYRNIAEEQAAWQGTNVALAA